MLGEIQETGSSGYLDSLAYIVKTDPEGNTEWVTKINYSSSDQARNAVETEDGGYLVTGTITDYSGKPYSVLYLVKLDGSGNIQWENTYDDPYYHNYSFSVIETVDGGFAVAGYGATSAGFYSAFALRTNILGEQLWFKKYWFGDDQVIYDIVQTPDGGFLAVGSITRENYEPVEIQSALLIIKLNGQGQMEWNKQYQDKTATFYAHTLIPAKDGGYLIGYRKSAFGKIANMLAKIDTSGSLLWEKAYPSEYASGSRSYSKLVSAEYGYALIGANTKGDYPNVRRQYAVLTVDDGGQTLGDYLYEGPSLYNHGDAAAASDGGFIVTGTIKRGDIYKAQLSKLPKPQEAAPPGERTLMNIAFTESEKKVLKGHSSPTVIQAVYSDGYTNTLSAAAQYLIEDPSIAAVDGQGRITGIEPGTTRLIASHQGLQATLPIIVLPDDSDELEPASLYLDSTEYSLSVGDKLDTRTYLYDYSTSYQRIDITHLTTFRSDNPEIADYDENGDLVGFKAGTTKIYAYYKGSYRSATVQVVRSSIP
ncbi:Bacterial Ig-like domain (group 2) [compost metagenome]